MVQIKGKKLFLKEPTYLTCKVVFKKNSPYGNPAFTEVLSMLVIILYETCQRSLSIPTGKKENGCFPSAAK